MHSPLQPSIGPMKRASRRMFAFEPWTQHGRMHDAMHRPQSDWHSHSDAFQKPSPAFCIITIAGCCITGCAITGCGCA
jgi:hypothetical protein